MSLSLPQIDICSIYNIRLSPCQAIENPRMKYEGGVAEEEFRNNSHCHCRPSMFSNNPAGLSGLKSMNFEIGIPLDALFVESKIISNFTINYSTPKYPKLVKDKQRGSTLSVSSSVSNFQSYFCIISPF